MANEGQRPFREREADRIPLHERIRNLRQKRGWTGYELARKAGISPSYVSLIENGLKVPEEAVALAIAGALGDDESLYRTWARTARHGDLGETRETLETALRITRDQGLRRRLASGDRMELPPGVPPSRGGSAAEAAGPPAISVRVLAEGSDPDHGGVAVVERVSVDAAAVQPEDREDLFAYRVGARSARRLRGLVEAGSLVVLSRRFRTPSPERIHAVRVRGEVVLSRTLWKGSTLLLLPSEGDSDFESVEAGDASRLRAMLLGSVVLSLRTWE